MDGRPSAVLPLPPRGSGRSPAARGAALEASLAALSPRMAAAAGESGELARAAEWLLDNAYAIQGALAQVAQDLPESFRRSLPVLRDGAFPGQLRVWVLARQACAGAGSLDLEQLRHLVATFPAASPLTLGELWALPALLRLEVVEDIVRTT
ncbi:MAG: hypothetical protein WAM82_16525, partial [Thermoanaerobaculia bacterium]